MDVEYVAAGEKEDGLKKIREPDIFFLPTPKDVVEKMLELANVKKSDLVYDLGCGDGELLSLLIKHKHCQGTGIEIDEKAIYQCIEKGLTVSHGDIASGLTDYSDKRFDYVILNESLQQVLDLKKTIFAPRGGRNWGCRR